jgi:hypothetical protein
MTKAMRLSPSGLSTQPIAWLRAMLMPYTPAPGVHSLATWTEVTMTAPSLDVGAARMCDAFVQALFVSGASISMFDRDGHQSTIAASSALAARAETLQFELGEGPHWDALSSGLPVLVPELVKQGALKWPMFSSAARELGIAAVFAFPMTIGAATIGVVDLYCTTPRRLDAHQVSLASSMAGRYAGPAAREAMRTANDAISPEEATTASIRREVHQATGMIQAQLNTTATDAFAHLRARAFSTGSSIDQVAGDVVGLRLDFSALPK